MQRKITIYHQEFVLCLVYLINALVLYFPKIYDAIYPFYDYISIVLILISLFASRILEIRKSSVLLMILIVIAGLLCARFSMLPLGDAFSVIWFCTLFFTFSQFMVSDAERKLFFGVNFFLWLYLIIYAVIYHNRFGQMFNYVTYNDTLNPNTVASGIIQFNVLMGVYLRAKKKVKLEGIFFIISIIGILLCDARSSIVFYLASILICLIGEKKKKNKVRFLKVCVIAIIILGFVFPLAWSMTASAYNTSTMFLGKRLFTGRERIWANFFNFLSQHKDSFFWGTGKNKELFWYNVFNLHNSYLQFFAQFGLIASVLFWGFIYFKMTCYPDCLLQKLHGYNIFMIYSLLLGIMETNFTYMLSIPFICYSLGSIQSVINRRNTNDS